MKKKAPSRASHPSALELHLLGPFRTVVDDVEVEEHRWARRKAKLLVKLLALSPHRRAHREQVMELLWPELEEKSASSHLNNTLYAARRALEPSLPPRADSRFIIAHEQQILLSAPARLWVDVEEFESRAAEAVKAADTAAYEAALGLYGGDLLVEDLYEDWIAARREALRLKRQALLAGLAALWESQGRYERAAERLRELIEADATNEEAHRNLMRLYALTGQRQQALGQYRQCRDALQSGLAAEPERETVELHKQILSHQLKPAPRDTPAPSATTRVPATHNLPQELTSFVGRTRELAAVKEALGAARLLTLTGPGGIGKTRLALRAATESLGDYADGAWFVELATLTDASLLPQAVASALGVQGEQNQAFPATLSEYLRHRDVLLVLDNCEHMVGACASLAETLLRSCPRLRILATSREALGVAGESLRRVPSLSVPEPEDSQTVRTTCESEAVRLFTDRVRLSNPRFRVTERNANAVARLCRQLDGIPLAVELAAARARVLSIEQILSKLDDRFRLLAGRADAASPQHQTLRATIDWSYNLLSGGEKILFARLSVFAGGCTLEAIEAVCAGGQVTTDEAFDLLSRLADKSLVFVEPRDAETRGQMLETIRRYGQERLRESGEEAALLARHCDWFLRTAEQAEQEMWKSGQNETLWVTRLEAERENMRAALGHAAESREAEAGLRIAGALWRFWATRGYLSEGREWFEKLLSLAEAERAAPAVRAKAFARAGALARDQGDFARGVALLEQGLSLYRAAGDDWGAAATLNGLGDAAQQQGDEERAVARYEESLSLFRALGDARAAAYLTHNLANVAKERGEHERATRLHLQSLAAFRELKDQRAAATALFNLGEIAHHQRDFKRAAALHTQSMEIRREINDKRGIICSLIELGNLARDEGDDARAAALYEESLLLSREMGDKRSVAFCFEGLATEAGRRGDQQRAARLLAAAEALREAIGAPISSIMRDDYERRLAHVRAGLDRETFDAAWTYGRAITLEQAVEMALTRNLA